MSLSYYIFELHCVTSIKIPALFEDNIASQRPTQQSLTNINKVLYENGLMNIILDTNIELPAEKFFYVLAGCKNYKLGVGAYYR